MANKNKDLLVSQIPLKVKPVKSPKKKKQESSDAIEKKFQKLKIYSTIKIASVLLLLIINTYLIITIAIKTDENNKISSNNIQVLNKYTLTSTEIGNWITSNNGLFVFSEDNTFFWYDNYEQLSNNYYQGTYNYKKGLEALEEMGYTEEEVYKIFGNDTKVENIYSINIFPTLSYRAGVNTTANYLKEKETWWFIIIIKSDGTALGYNKTLDLRYSLKQY